MAFVNACQAEPTATITAAHLGSIKPKTAGEATKPIKVVTNARIAGSFACIDLFPLSNVTGF